jgi:hypothetical protein
MDRAKNTGAPRKLWDSLSEGTAIRVGDHYEHKPRVVAQKRKLTEAEDNAIGRAIRRRKHRLERGWAPFAKR